MSELEAFTEAVVNSPLARALRALQSLDQHVIPNRHLLIRAETLIGELMGYQCTGTPDGWDEDGTVAAYSHDGDTCPIHEWLVETDSPDYEEAEET